MSTGASTHAHCAEQLKTKLPCQGVILKPFVKPARMASFVPLLLIWPLPYAWVRAIEPEISSFIRTKCRNHPFGEILEELKRADWLHYWSDISTQEFLRTRVKHEPKVWLLKNFPSAYISQQCTRSKSFHSFYKQPTDNLSRSSLLLLFILFPTEVDFFPFLLGQPLPKTHQRSRYFGRLKNRNQAASKVTVTP